MSATILGYTLEHANQWIQLAVGVSVLAAAAGTGHRWANRKHERVVKAIVKPLLDPLEARLAAVEAELKPNGGASLRDEIQAIAAAVGAKRPRR